MKKSTQPKKQFNLTQHASMKVMLSCLIGSAFTNAYALPTGEEVKAGNASFVRDGQTLNINQTTQQVIVNWQSFGIAANEAVNLYQPNQGSALFRVVGSDPSQIFGSLTATGRLFLINPNGILFAHGARVDVGSLVATTMQMSDEDYLAKKYQFNGDSTASVINKGTIRTEDGGYIVLLGNTVENSGSLTANQGSVVLASAQSALLDVYGDGLVQVKLSGEALNAVVNNTGNITTDGGAVQLAANARVAAINVSGVVQANSLVERNGVIRLEGGANSTVLVSGKLEASGKTASAKGGYVAVTGERVGLLDGTTIDVSGNAGGGTALIGGDYQGKNANIQNADRTYVASGASIIADALDSGDGGKVIVWANDITRYYGSISAKGAGDSGNGGFAEVSGKRLLDFQGKADLSAAHGRGGNLLLDPLNITLTTADANTTGFTAASDLTEAFADDAGLTSTFNVNAGGSFAGVAAGSSIILQATNNITVSSAFNVATATGSANNSLVLQANNNINVNAAVTTTGTGAITMNADADNSGTGNLAIGANITSQAGGITLSGATITRSAGNITATGAANGNAGNISITGLGTVNLGAAAIAANGGTASAGNVGRNGGVITISGTGVTTTGAKTASGSAGSGASQAGGNAGSVNITSTSGMSVGAITATGGNAGTGNANGGNAGTITLTNNTAGNVVAGALTARTGTAVGTGAGGAAGSIAVTNTAVTGSLSTGAINTQGNTKGNGGNITLSSLGTLAVSGAVTSSGGTTTTGNNGKSAGNITITGRNTSVTGAISASGGNAVGTTQAGGNAGTVSITATGTLTTAAITSRTGNAVGTGAGGTVGGITLSGTSVTSGALTTTGGTNGKGGAVSVSSTTGNLTTGAIVSSGGGSNASTSGNSAGNVSLTSAGSLSTTGVVSAIGSTGGSLNQGGGNAGNITLNANSGITITGALSADGGNGFAGSTLAGAGNAGAVSITNNSSGNISTSTLSGIAGQAFGTGAGGSASGISVTNLATTGGVTTSTIRTTGGTNAHGGNVSVSSQGNITTGTITTSAGALGTGSVSAGRNAGTVALTAGGNVAVGAIIATGGAGLGTNQNGGTGGTVNLDAGSGSTITMTSVTTTGGNRTGTGTAGVGGNITVADAALLSANTTITSTGGSAGVGAGGTVTFGGTVNSSGANRSLAIDSNGATIFAGTIGNTLALSSLTTNATGTTAINGGAVTTIGAQTYNDAATLGAATTFTTTNSNVTFGSSINASGNNVVVAAGTGAVTATNVANDFGNLAITAGSANIRDANAIVLGASNIVGAYTLQTTGAVTQSAGVTVGGTSTIAADTSNDITLNNVANNFNTVVISSGRDVNVVDSDALTIGTSTVTTLFARTLSGDLTLGGNITATGTGNAIELVVADQFINNVGAGGLNASSVAGRFLVWSQDPVNDTRGGLAYNFKQYNATYGVTTVADSNFNNNGFLYTTAPILNATVSGVTKQYNGTVATTLTAANYSAITGTIDGDSVATTALPTIGTYDNANAGTGKTVNVTGTVNGADGAATVYGYQVGIASAGGEITKASVTISTNDVTKTYNGTTDMAGATGQGAILTAGTLFNNESNGNLLDNISGGTFAYTDKNAGIGNKIVTVSGVTLNDGNSGGNYNVSYVDNNTSSINKANITAVTGITADDKTYDGNTSATIDTSSANFTGIVAGESLTVGAATGSFNSKDVVTANTVNISGITLADGADLASNYNLTNSTATVAAVITPKSLTVTADKGQTKILGSADPASFTYGTQGLVFGDALTGALIRNSGEVTGNYAINQGTLTAGSNYALTYIGSNFTILAPPTSPRNDAGLVDLNPMLSNYTNQQLFVLNVGSPAAGNGNDGNANGADLSNCEQKPEPLAKDKDFILMLNFGLKLPKGMDTTCI